MPTLAIIGAGVAGLAAARRLRQQHPQLAITLYEKSRGLGGRAATRRREGFTFDHGAQYAKAPTPELLRLLTEELPRDGLHDIALPVWTFDGAGVISEGDPQQNADPKWTYRDGLNRLGKLLGEGLDVRREVRVGALRRRTTDDGRRATESYQSAVGGRWSVIDVDGHLVAEADLVLLTPPAPQAAEILAASELDTDVREQLLGALTQARYRRCLSFALAYDRQIARPFYALVNTDRQHPISWLALEHTKAPERCPPGHSLLIPQMAPQWSIDHWELPVEQVQLLVVELVSELLGEDLRQPLWCDRQGWRYALPDGGADFDALNSTGSGLFFAGDYTAGQGRVHLAIESGWRVADVIGQVLQGR